MRKSVYRIYNYVDISGTLHHLSYCLLSEGGAFGVAIEDSLGDQAQVRDVTTIRDRAISLLDLLARNGVTPCALRDVVDDWL